MTYRQLLTSILIAADDLDAIAEVRVIGRDEERVVIKEAIAPVVRVRLGGCILIELTDLEFKPT